MVPSLPSCASVNCWFSHLQESRYLSFTSLFEVLHLVGLLKSSLHSLDHLLVGLLEFLRLIYLALQLFNLNEKETMSLHKVLLFHEWTKQAFHFQTFFLRASLSSFITVISCFRVLFSWVVLSTAVCRSRRRLSCWDAICPFSFTLALHVRNSAYNEQN